MKRSKHKEKIVLIPIYLETHTKRKLTELKRELDKLTIIIGDLTFLSVIESMYM